MIDFIAYILVRVLNKIFEFLPISLLLWVGRRLGTAIFLVNKKRRLVAYANLKSAFASEKTPSELKRLTRKVYQNMVQTFIEVLNLTKVNRKYVDKYVEVVNMDRIRNASRSGRGTILLTAHFGDWELSSLVSSVEGFPILVLAREQKMKRLNEILNRLRESNGCTVIRKGMSTKNILRALKENSIVGILSDQDAGKSGVLVNFFGRPTSSHAGPMEIAKHTDSLILPNFIVRTGGPYHKLYLEEYIDFRSQAASGDDVRANLQKFMSMLESYIRKYPDQWLWLHKRWKSTPLKTVLVLNDGRWGHLNQSLSVARKIQLARVTQGYTMDDTHIIVIDVKFKNKLMRPFLSACACLATWRCHGCMRCMKIALEADSYERLMKIYADFIVSCGSSLGPVNILMAKENNAKNIVIMKPGLPLSQYNLAIIPRHDKPPKIKNVIATAIAPNLIDEELLNRDGRIIGQSLRVGTKPVVGFLVGGESPEFALTGRLMRSTAEKILKFCDRIDADILVTTSRRTPPEAESVLKEVFGKSERCKLLVIANEGNIKEAVGGILALAKLVIVSAESISMISEAIASGKKVVAFALEKKKDNKAKHEDAMSALNREGYLHIGEADNLDAVIDAAWNDPAPPVQPDDDKNIFEAVRRLI